MFTFEIRLLFFISLSLLMSCDSTTVYKNKATSLCSNLNLHIGLAFPSESVFLFYNEELIMECQIDSLDGYNFSREFCLKYNENDSLKIVTEHGGKLRINETFLIEDPTLNYNLSVSVPYPKNWEKLSKSGISTGYMERGWGYLSIDSSIRYINLYPDTLLKYPIDSIPMNNIRDK